MVAEERDERSTYALGGWMFRGFALRAAIRHQLVLSDHRRQVGFSEVRKKEMREWRFPRLGFGDREGGTYATARYGFVAGDESFFYLRNGGLELAAKTP